MISLLGKFKEYVIGVVLIICFIAGWWGHKLWTKPVERIVTVQVPVYINGGPTHDEVVKPGGTVTPGVHYGPAADQPKPPDPDNSFHPINTTVITLPVYKPVKVFHQNDLQFKETVDESVSVCVNTRVWAQYEDGAPVLGLHADTTFVEDKKLTFPLKVRVKTPPVYNWAVGGRYNLNTKTPGAWIERDFAFLRTGVDVDFTKHEGTQTTLKLGLRF